MDSQDVWYSYNLQRAKNRKRMKDKYNSMKLQNSIRPRKKAVAKPPDQEPHEYNQVLVYHEVFESNSEELIFDSVNIPDYLEEEEEQPKSDCLEVHSVHEDARRQEQVIPDGTNYLTMANENMEKIRQLINEMDPRSALLCSQAFLSLISTFRPRLPTDRNMHTETEDYLNCCPDCGTYYRIIQIHHCGLAEN